MRMCACETSGCADEVHVATDQWRANANEYREPSDLPEALGNSLRGIAVCERIARIEGAFEGPTTVAECDRLLALEDDYLSCDSAPETAKATMRASIHQQRQAWVWLRDPFVPAEARLASAHGCVQHAAELALAASEAGCAPSLPSR
jgi:hypothetical protein